MKMNKTIVILLAAVILIASGVLGHFGVLTPEQVKTIWTIVAPLALAALGLQNAAVSAEIKEVKARMLTPPEAKKD
jgi:uncharacterized membrane protein